MAVEILDWVIDSKIVNEGNNKLTALSVKSPNAALEQLNEELTKANRNGQRIQLRKYCRKAPTIDKDALCKDLIELFDKYEDCECIVMQDEAGKVAGLAMRNHFSYKLAHRYSVALFYNKHAIQLIDQNPVVVHVSIDPKELIQLALSRDPARFYDCIVVTEHNKPIGILTVGDILNMMGELEMELERSKTAMIESISETIKDIASNVSNVNQVAIAGEASSLTMVDYTLQGKEALTKVQQAFCELEQSSKLQEESMLQLQREIGAITSVSQLIKELAEQSNLLAINATIEAAHAGQYGRGFTVVANEFTKLAMQTKKSAVEISDITASIVEALNTAHQLADQGRELTNSSASYVTTAQQVYEQIFKTAADNKHNVKEITDRALATYEQTQQVVNDLEMLKQTDKAVYER